MSLVEVVSYSLQGDSYPIVVKKDGKKLFVKLRAGLCGEYALPSEWLGNRLGSLLGLNTRAPEWVPFNEQVVFHELPIEVRELIEKSKGINIGFSYIEHVETINSKKLDTIGKEPFTEAFLLDVLMLNVDRTMANPNLLKTNEGIVLSDYESSLLFSQVIYGKNFLNNVSILECLRNNLFYQRVNPSEIDSFLGKIEAISFDELLIDIPVEVLSEPKREKLLYGLEQRKLEGWNIEDTLQRLEKVVVETKEEKAIRTRRNREKLEYLIKSR